MGTTFARLLALILIVAPMAGAAQETDVTGKVAVELNTVSDGEGACTLTFMVTNGHPVDIEKLVYETVLFDAAGSVDRLTLFDFGALPVGRPRVRQFAVPDLTCDGLGRVLFNGLHTCASDGLAQQDCAKGLLPSSRVEIEVLG
ncbi:hypothetical protein GCM10007385_40110 [Tateyamaria omphalii]|uniref:hypothetical protein n=1 Tax=Tateyamaria omphalii TaxID=299262 RepID=UPI001675A1A0|nr:hypothetical protein [Tateyamaria omphalii]GGX67021.1 hypothetical protein GCM10007385_40110 [Tateyamaria omphalii]